MKLYDRLKRTISLSIALLMAVPLNVPVMSTAYAAATDNSLTAGTVQQDVYQQDVNTANKAASMSPRALVTPGATPTVVSTYITADKTMISTYGEQVQLKVMAKMSSGPDIELRKVTASNSTDPQLYSVHYTSSVAGVTINDVTGVLTYDGSSGSVPVDVKADVKYLDVVYFEGFEGGNLGSFTLDPGATDLTTTSVIAKTGGPAHSGTYSANRNNSKTGNTVRADMGSAINGTVTMWVYNGQPTGNSRNNIYVGTKTVAATGAVDISNGLLLGEHWDGSTGSGTQFVSRIMASSFTATPVSRGTTPAWHEFKWDITSGTDAKMYIDGTQVASTAGETKYQYIAFAGNWLASNNVTYYDDVKATKLGTNTSPALSIPVQADEVQSVSVSGQGGVSAITADAGTLQMLAAVAPAGAPAVVSWKVENEDGTPTNKASISATGLLKALRNGTVKVTATSVSKPAISNSMLVTISGQTVKVTGIMIQTVSGANSFNTLDPVPLSAVVEPSDAGIPAIAWKVVQGTDVASISNLGILTPVKRGKVQVVAESTDGSLVKSNTLELQFNIRNTYYVSSTAGNDANDGLSEATAWKSLDKVNGTTFGPGDEILFKAGDIWNGQLRLNGSGEAGQPIRVNKYGSANPEVRPIFNGNGTLTDQVMPLGSIAGQHYAATVEVRNGSFWEVSNLEVTNYNADVKNMRAGIMALNEKGTTVTEWMNNQLQHIYITDCYVHDVNSDPAAFKMTGGILVLGNYSDVLVESNKVVNVAIEGVRNAGMAPSGSPNGGAPTVMNDIRFRNNYVQDVQGDGLVISNVADDGNPDTYNGKVEYNTIVRFANKNVGSLNYAGNWVYGSNDTVFQYNETFGGVYGYNDGEAWDVDLYCKNIVYQYNYSHENRGGFSLVMPGSKYSFYRYNLSVNDGNGDAIFDYFPDNNAAGAPWIYNNTFYIGKDITTNFFDVNATSYVKFANNIILSLGKVNNFANGGTITQGYIKNNIIYPQMNIGSSGGSLEVANNLFANPQLARPGEIPANIITAKDRFDASRLDAYKLLANSPAIGAGWKVDVPAGYTQAVKDLFGNPVGSAIDIGAHQFTNDAPANTVSEVMPASVALNQRNVSLLLGEGVFLTATVEPATAWNKVVSWASDNPSVATVDANGAVKAVALGTANITVKSTADPSLTATAKITVKAPVTPTSDMKVKADYPYLDASSNRVKLRIGNILSDGTTRELTKNITEANQPRLISVNYSTDNPNVTIDSNGVLSVTGDLGAAAEINVTANVTYEDVVYSEGFESGTIGDFKLDTGTDFVVSIQPSTEQAHSGVYSVKRINSVKGGMSKVFPADLRGIASMWIYDDGTTRSNRAVGGAGPILTDSSKLLGLGLFYDGTYGSPTNFATRIQTGATGWTVSDVPRSIGWHELKWDYTDPAMVRMYIDDKPAATANVSGLRAVSLVNWWNSSSGDFYYDDIRVAVPKTSAAIPLTVKIKPTQVEGMRIWGAGGANTISTDRGTLQIEGGLIPFNIPGQDYSLIWSVEEETGRATISNTGLLSAVRDGRVKVIAQSVADPTQKAEMYVTITNQYVPVTGVNVRGTNDKSSIDTAGGTLQLLATISPSNATNKKVTWKILNTDGSSTNVAKVSDTGLVTAVKNGTARVHAISEDGSLDGALDITVTNQLPVVESIDIQTPNGTTVLDTGTTLALSAVIKPDNAVNKAVTWTVVNSNGTNASITADGMLSSGTVPGKVTVVATAKDALGTVGSKVLTIKPSPAQVLQAKIAEAEATVSAAVIGTEPGQYPQSAADALTQAIASARAVLGDAAATQQQLDGAAAALTAELAAFDAAKVPTPAGEPANKDALQAKLAQAEAAISAAVIGAEPGQYPQSAVDALKQAIASARAVLSDATATQQQVDAAAAALTAAIAAFDGAKVPKPAGEPANKDALRAKLAEAEAAVSAAVIGGGAGQYPQSAADSLKQAIASAKAVLSDATATQQQVDAAAAALVAQLTVFQSSVITVHHNSSKPSGSGSAVTPPSEPATTEQQPAANGIHVLTDEGKALPQERDAVTGHVTIKAEDKEKVSLTFQASELKQVASTNPAANVSIAIKGFVYPLTSDVVDKVSGIGSFLKANDTRQEQLKVQVKIELTQLTEKERHALANIADASLTNSLASNAYEVHLILAAPNGQTLDVKAFDNQRTMFIEVDPSYKDKILAAVSISEEANHEQEAGIRTVKYVEMNGKSYMQIRTASHSKYALIENPVTFRDVTDVHWAKAIVEEAGARLLVQGAGEGRFNPDARITRAEYVTMLVNALGLSKTAGSVPQYEDVRPDDWFADEMAAAQRAGLLDWVEGNRLKPNDAITRAEMARATAAAARYVQGGKLKSAAVSNLDGFIDANQVAAGDRSALAWSVEQGLVNGTVDPATGTTVIAPNETATRAQAAAIMLRLLRTLSLI